MARMGMWFLGAAFLVFLTACEKQETPPGGGATTPAATPAEKPAAAPAKPAGEPAKPPPAPAGAPTTQTAKPKAPEGSSAGADIIRQVRERYHKLADDELAKADRHIDELKAKLAQATEAARPELQKQITELSAKVKAAREMLQKLASESDQAWGQAKKSMETTLKEIKTALGEAAGSQPTTQPASRPAPPQPKEK